MPEVNTVELATELTMAWLSNPSTRAAAGDVPSFLASMHKAVSDLSAPTGPPAAEPDTKAYEPAVSVRKSLALPDHIISLIDGKPYKTLKRHLARHGLTPAAYRERYGLKADYPMTAPSYSAARTAMAKKLGLGRKKGETVGTEQTASPPRIKTAKPRVSAAEAKKAARAHLGGGED